MILLIILSVLAASSSTIKPLNPSTLPTESIFTTVRSFLGYLGTLLCALFTVAGLRNLFHSLTATVYGRGEERVRKMGWWPRVALAVGGVCLVGWAVMSAVSFGLQLTLAGVAALGIYLVVKERASMIALANEGTPV